jgi:hypothetical protein
MRRRVIVSAAIIGSASSLAVATSADAARAPPGGDGRGLALLARVHRAYTAVPAVVLSRTTSDHSRFGTRLSCGRGGWSLSSWSNASRAITSRLSRRAQQPSPLAQGAGVGRLGRSRTE